MIHTCPASINLSSINFRDFVKSAWADIERFKEQKNHDLKEALISYAVMQISMCKKVCLLGKYVGQVCLTGNQSLTQDNASLPG